MASYQYKLEITFHYNKETIRLSHSLKCTHMTKIKSQFKFLEFISLSPPTLRIQVTLPWEEVCQDDSHPCAWELGCSGIPQRPASLWFTSWMSSVAEKSTLRFCSDGPLSSLQLRIYSFYKNVRSCNSCHLDVSGEERHPHHEFFRAAFWSSQFKSSSPS